MRAANFCATGASNSITGTTGWVPGLMVKPMRSISLRK
jgi:hypothetical protein